MNVSQAITAALRHVRRVNDPNPIVPEAPAWEKHFQPLRPSSRVCKTVAFTHSLQSSRMAKAQPRKALGLCFEASCPDPTATPRCSLSSERTRRIRSRKCSTEGRTAGLTTQMAVWRCADVFLHRWVPQVPLLCA